MSLSGFSLSLFAYHQRFLTPDEMVKGLPVHSTCSPLGPDGVVRCFNHALPTALKTSSTAANLDRKFYCCSIPQDDLRRCKFFYWQDELFPDFAKDLLDRMDRTQVQARQVPSKAKRSSDTEAFDAPMTPSQKRLKIIEQALSQAQPPSTPASPTSPDIRQQHSPSEGSSLLQPPRTPVRRSRSSQHSARQSSNGDAVPPTKERTRTDFSLSGIDDTDGWVAIEVITPPATDPTRSQASYGPSHSSRMSSATLSSHSPVGDRKGKSSARRDDDPFSNPELPELYDTSNVSKKLDFSQPPRNPSDEGVAGAVAELLSCAHMFNPRIQALLLQLPKKIEELGRSERKRIAAEKSTEIKAKRIATLDKEVAELRARVRELEKQLH